MDNNDHTDNFVYLQAIERVICNDGMFMDSKFECVLCKPNEIFINDTCVPCGPGTYKKNLNDKICENCIKGCSVCTNSTTCVTCFEGFYNNSSKICSPCDPNCKTCQDGNVNNICLTCNDP